ncbi:nitroreductase family protein [Methanosphaera sp. WGK6]|uniref:nitroreductase family protein n=1 Tax=Methanosphaera sp. WGK6 TaxID=1561964 RepID=UPI00084CB0FA|nr:nitroreductase family protein [Methanosphaera sp. WGK6]OED30693.1 methanogenesis marker protein 16 [Methanosphaera sp. WGK6]
MKLSITTEKCVGCGLCASVCIRDNIIVNPTVEEVNNGECFECGHCMAICPTGAITLKQFEDQMDVVEKYDATQIPVTTENLLDLYKQRRSIRWFKNEKIDENTFNTLFEGAYYSPSAMNKQDVEFLVVDDRLDDFIELVYEIIKVEENKFSRIKQLGEYLKDKNTCKYHPLLWEGKQLILGFATDKTSTVIAATRIELLAYTMGLGGFYSLFIQKADEIDHERLMTFFPEIDKSKHMYSTFIIGYPRKKFKRTIPHKKIKITYN